MSLHVKCRNAIYSGSAVARFPVPDEKVPWSVAWHDYKPPQFTSPLSIGKPWSDNETRLSSFNWNQLDGSVDRTSHHGPYNIVDEIPQNPRGRTGLEHRGILGRWGPNHAADPIVTRWKRAADGSVITSDKTKLGILQFVAIKRSDTKEWAIPGGMIDPGEVVSKTLQREFAEESLNMLDMDLSQKIKIQDMLTPFFSNGSEVYRGYVDDPRNTDNSWMETIAYNFHDEDGSVVGSFNLHAGDDAVGVCWVDIDSNLKLYASHTDMIKQVALLHNANW